MKHREFYNKYKTNYAPIVNPLFYKGNWWRIVLITMIAILIGPLILYKHQRSVTFSLDYYLRLIEYFLVMIVPFVAFLIWANWREATKRSRGYGWVGKFEVVKKQSNFAFCYLLLAPGDRNKLRVNRIQYEKIRVGDFVVIRRDAFGTIEEVSKVNNFANRLGRLEARRIPKSNAGAQSAMNDRIS